MNSTFGKVVIVTGKSVGYDHCKLLILGPIHLRPRVRIESANPTQCRRWWANVKLTLCQRLVFAGMSVIRQQTRAIEPILF